MHDQIEQPSPWQAPPPFLLQRLLSGLLASELRWGLHVATWRLISCGWRAAVDETLQALAPRPAVPVDEAVAVAARFPALRILRVQSPSEQSRILVPCC